MSEYQFVHFLAIDRPLDEEQLEFMRRQSSRAEITPWEFTNEYHFGDFHGKTLEMLRRGYDVHLHYANFGIRRLMFRLARGLPCDLKTFKAFKPRYGVAWHQDKTGEGGILEIQPDADAATYDDNLFDGAGELHTMAPIRELLIGGDLRPLYLAWLACAGDDGSLEPPVPAGLADLPRPLAALADFYEIDEDLLTAAAARSPTLSDTDDADETLTAWIEKQSKDELRGIVRRMLQTNAPASRAEILAQIGDSVKAPAWPTAEPTRTLADLRQAADEIREARHRQEKIARDAARRQRIAAIAADPDKSIAKVNELVKERSTRSYEQAAQLLADLREALGPKSGPARAREIAQKLRKAHPRNRLLISALRKHQLLD
jgi:hypothetical protein